MIHVKRFAVGILVVLGLAIVFFGIPYEIGFWLHKVLPERIDVGEGMIIAYVVVFLLGGVYGIGSAILDDSPRAIHDGSSPER